MNYYSNYRKLYTPALSTLVIDNQHFGLALVDLSSSLLLSGPTEEEIKSNDPRVWGPHLWKYMHCSAANYPDRPTKEQIDQMITWLKTLTVTIPCKKCKEHYSQYIDRHQHTLREICASKDKLFNFIVDIHNQVNKRNNKPIVSYDEARQLYCK